MYLNNLIKTTITTQIQTIPLINKLIRSKSILNNQQKIELII